MRIEWPNNIFIFSVLVALILLPLSSFGQEDEPSEAQIDEFATQARHMINFLEFSLNVLGDPTVPASEKDIIINESFLKIFKDEKVQVEDDLDENREVVTNKDVQAYLKDVDFFFKHVVFDFNILDVAPDYNQDGALFYTVKLMRNLKGVTVGNDSINSDQERYVEINVDEEKKDLRIASIYTTRLSRKEELTYWWADLSREWKTYLGVGIEVKEGLRLSEVQEFSDSTYWADDIQFTDSLNIIDFVIKAAAREEINLEGSTVITDLKPLDQLKNLKKLDISSSVITDLFPIRNLTTLEYLDCSNTKVEDLQPLRYCKSLRELYLNNTPVTSITVIEHFDNLEILHLEQTVIDSLPSIDRLSHLKDLNCASTNLQRLDSISSLLSLESLDFSNTAVDDLTPIATLTNLKRLIFNSTSISSVAPITSLTKLREIGIENTEIQDITYLQPLDNLKIIRADNSKIGLEEFTAFAKSRPDVDIIFISKDLETFWEQLDPSWIAVLEQQLDSDDTVSSTKRHKLLKVKQLVIKTSDNITDLSPLKYLPLLEHLDFSETSISDLSPIKFCQNLSVVVGAGSQVTELAGFEDLEQLHKVDFSDCRIRDISALSNVSQVDTLIFNNTDVQDIQLLNKLKEFTIASFDGSQVTDDEVVKLTYDANKSTVVYKSGRLRAWWGSMDDHWQDLFMEMEGLPSRPSKAQLHQLAGKKKLEVNGPSLRNLDPISEMVRLESLSFSDSRINSLHQLTSLRNLKVLRCPRNPISEVEPLAVLLGLVVLDLENTQVKDLRPLSTLTRLKELKFSGTMVKDISPIEGLKELEVLEFSKTRVRQINALSKLDKLRVLKCYNNKISDKKIEEFKNNHPDCEVVFY